MHMIWYINVLKPKLKPYFYPPSYLAPLASRRAYLDRVVLPYSTRIDQKSKPKMYRSGEALREQRATRVLYQAGITVT